MPPPAVFLACFQKAALKKLESFWKFETMFLDFLPARIKPAEMADVNNLWELGAQDPKNKDPLLPVALGKEQVLRQSGADQRGQAQ